MVWIIFHDRTGFQFFLKISNFACFKTRPMIENDKIQYIPPVSEAVSLNCESMVCLSGEFDGFGMEEIW